MRYNSWGGMIEEKEYEMVTSISSSQVLAIYIYCDKRVKHMT